MKKSPSPSPSRTAAPRKRTGAAAGAAQADLQPPATGANRGSPAAPVMKQFAKTGAEGGNRS